MVLEGGRSWREGYVASLSPKRVVELTQAQVLVVLKHEQTSAGGSRTGGAGLFRQGADRRW